LSQGGKNKPTKVKGVKRKNVRKVSKTPNPKKKRGVFRKDTKKRKKPPK